MPLVIHAGTTQDGCEKSNRPQRPPWAACNFLEYGSEMQWVRNVDFLDSDPAVPTAALGILVVNNNCLVVWIHR